jgi:hypothetical protein
LALLSGGLDGAEGAVELGKSRLLADFSASASALGPGLFE